MKNQAQLIAYVDRLPGGTFRDLQQLLDGPLQGAFGGVHVLPFFHPIDGADAGFDPIDHTQVDHRLGGWDDVAALAARTEVMADVIVNHVSSRSPQFQDYLRRGEDSPYAGMFLTYSRLFPQGARESDLLALHTTRPTLPFTKYQTATGEQALLWTTFTSDQIDIDVSHPEGRRYLADVLARFHATGIKAIRLDAVGFAVKKAGTSCFMIPETFAFIADFAAQAHACGMEVLVEVHGHYQDQIDVSRQVDWVYDFALPPLVLHTLYARNAAALTRWLEIRPGNTVTVLDTHDGIGVQDVGADRRRGRFEGLLTDEEIDALVETIHRRSRGESRHASGSAANNVDSSQINCTFYDALGRSDAEYPDRPRHPMLRPGDPADLLRGPAGRQQRSRPAASHRCGARHQPPLLHGGRTGAGIGAPGRSVAVGTAADSEYPSGVRWRLSRGAVAARPARSGVEERRRVRAPRREPESDVRGRHLFRRRCRIRRHIRLAGGDGGPTVTSRASSDGRNLTLVKALTYLMFAMFAMTTDSVGVIIPEVIRTYQLSLTAAGTFQYATMTGIAVAGLFLGSLADRFGRRPTIVVGLTLFAAACFLLAGGDAFLFFAVLLGVSGLAIGIFKTGALALIGDISTSTAQHTSIMNAAEGFFGVGAIIGPAILVRLLAAGVSWKWLYGIAGVICVALIVLALVVRYPEASKPAGGSGFSGTGRALKNPYVLAFSTGAFLYVGVEAAIYVWMPTLLQSYGGAATRTAAYSISVFFILRAAGRFLGAWMLTRVQWQAVLALCSGGILLCFVVSMAGGASWAVYLLPLSGLFMSVVYPTINSKGISCVPKAEHGAAAGVILFFTCVSAVLAPLAIGAVSDAFGRIVYGFWLATGLAALLFLGSLLNWLLNPTRALLEQRDVTE